jgi:hypothetical protein
MPANDTLLAIFQEPEQVARALDNLRSAGFAPGDLEVLSDAPYPEGAFGEQPAGHHLYAFTLVGAVVGFALGILVTVGTQLSYPLVTGGKPILSIPPMINIIFEGTMLGAILFSVGGILFESRLPTFRAAPYDPRISDGYLGLVVSRPNAKLDVAERAVRRAGAVDVVKGEG